MESSSRTRSSENMARYNEILVGRYNRALQKLLGIKGGPPSPQLTSDITANIQFFHGVEVRYLEGWNRYGFFAISTAVPANGSAVQVRNPKTSGVVAVIEQLTLHITGAANGLSCSNGTRSVDLPTPATPANARLDPRGGPTTALVFSSQNTVGGLVGDLLNIFYRSDAATGVMYDAILFQNQEIPLLPGDGILVSGKTLNSDVNVCWRWRERALEESELA
jgi:hypothetical protein